MFKRIKKWWSGLLRELVEEAVATTLWGGLLPSQRNIIEKFREYADQPTQEKFVSLEAVIRETDLMDGVSLLLDVSSTEDDRLPTLLEKILGWQVVGQDKYRNGSELAYATIDDVVARFKTIANRLVEQKQRR